MVAFTRTLLIGLVILWGGSTLQAQEKPSPAAALEKLKAGNERFAADKPSTRDVKADKRKELAKGQAPFAIILTCADSRVAPELVFDTGLGELFVLRVAGNIADPAVVGSIEYAVEHLHSPLIVVLGHESCGAVAAALDGKPLPGDLGWLIKQVKVGDKLPDDKDAKMSAGIRNNVRAAAADVEMRSKIIHEEVNHKKVAIVAGVYSLKSGKVEWLSAPEKKKLQPDKKRPEPEKLNAPSVKEVPAPPAFPGPSLSGTSTAGAGDAYSRGVVVNEAPVRFPRLRAFFQRGR